MKKTHFRLILLFSLVGSSNSCGSNCEVWIGDKDTLYVFNKKWEKVDGTGKRDGVYVIKTDSIDGQITYFDCKIDTCFYQGEGSLFNFFLVEGSSAPVRDPYRWVIFGPLTEILTLTLITPEKFAYKYSQKCTLNYRISKKIFVDTTGGTIKEYQ